MNKMRIRKKTKSIIIVVCMNSAWHIKIMNELQKRNGYKTEIEELNDIIWRSERWTRFIGARYAVHAERMELLRHILCGIDKSEREETEQNIYRYGSLIREKDFIARQMFLWLLEMAAETEPTEA